MTANITFSEAFEKYVNYLKDYKNSSPKTIATYSSFIKQFHVFVKYQRNSFEVQVSSLTIDDIHSYILHKKSEKSDSYIRKNKPLSPNTIFLHIAAIRSFFKYLNIQHWSDLNYVHIEQTSTIPPMVHTMTDEELHSLMQAPSMEPRPLIRIRNRIIMLLGYYCGLRAHEILMVKFSDIPKNG
ncbi:MAG: phage integrase N-terminal SAM-like domain-containing protein [bacterium]|nr:phage integrase N-terminal SAM-like domain-containing protein [bacterium]